MRYGTIRCYFGQYLPIVDGGRTPVLKWQLAFSSFRRDSIAHRCSGGIYAVGGDVIMAFLELIRGSSPGTRYEIDGEVAVIGRSAECEVPLDTPAVSRRHAAVVRDGEGYYLEDLKSRNGTILNEKPITERALL